MNSERFYLSKARGGEGNGLRLGSNAVAFRVGDDAAGAVIACLIGHGIPEPPKPIDADMPTMFVPLQPLENLAPGTWFLHVFATMPAHRGKGLGTQRLEFVEAF